MALLKCDGCGGTHWRTRPSRLYATMIYQYCTRCGLVLPSVWPLRDHDLVRLGHRRYHWKSMALRRNPDFVALDQSSRGTR